MKPLRIAHVIPSVAAEASGPSGSVVGLVKALSEQGHEISLHAIGHVREIPGVRVHRHKGDFGPRYASLESSLAMARALLHERNIDVVHNHSLWAPPNIYPAVLPLLGRTRLVTSPRGTLSTWALDRSRLKKRIVWHTAQQWTLRLSTALHATADEEAEDIARVAPRKKIVTIPNGFDAPPQVATERSKTVLFLGRLHEVKGLDLLLDAWAEIADGHPAWNLRIVGPPSEYGTKLEASARARGLSRISFDAPLYGEEKHRAYAQAEVFVLPSHSENFAMVVLEALAQGTPVIASRGTPWRALEKEGCGRWVDARTELAGALNELLRASDARRRDMGKAGRAWVLRDFSWGAIGKRMIEELYRPIVR